MSQLNHTIMKTIFVTVVILMASFLNITVNAQNIKFGLRAGINVSNIGGKDVELDEDSKLNYRPGFHIGPYANFGISESFSVESAALLSTKGFNMITSEIGSDFSYESKAKAQLTYLDLPILASINIGQNFRFFAGPQLSFLLKDKVKESSTICFQGNCVNESDEYDSDGFLRKTDLGLTLGLGYNFSSGLNLNSSYDLGLSSLDSEDNNHMYNRVFKISVGFTF